MAFTGDLEHLHIVDIIQLIHTTRKSGTFSVRGNKGESRIIFSNGYLVGASHLNNRIRIGTVLVRMNVITRDDLIEALEVQRKAGKNRKPLISTLIEMGRVGPEEAARGLRKLIEITIVELMGWAGGTFTFDTDDIAVTPECSYPIGKMEQAMGLDAQMVLMDALRVFDERERDRQAGKDIASYEYLYEDVVSSPIDEETGERRSFLTADDLGLGDLDNLERKIPQFVPVMEVFDPAEIHRQKIKETLRDFSPGEQEVFVSFLKKSSSRMSMRGGSARAESGTGAVILFSEDEFIKHSIMTICKNEELLVFATDGEEELDHILAQCLSIRTVPVVVFDYPLMPEGIFSEEKIVSIRSKVMEKYPRVPIVQMGPLSDYSFILRSYQEGVTAFFPMRAKDGREEFFIRDSIAFLEAFKTYVGGLCRGRRDEASAAFQIGKLRDRMDVLRDLFEPSDISLALLRTVAETFERTITFFVRPTELVGERALGVQAEKSLGPTSASKLKVPLSGPSVFLEAIRKGRLFYGECVDETVKNCLFEKIGRPRRSKILLLPLKSRGRVVALTYGDFGGKEAADIQVELLEILAEQAGLLIENSLFRKQLGKAPQQRGWRGERNL